MMRSDSRTHDRSGSSISAMILDSLRQGIRQGILSESARIWLFWKQVTQSFQWLAVNSLPLWGREFSRGRGELSSPGQRFSSAGRELPFRDWRHEIKPCVAGQYPIITLGSVH